MRQARRSSSAMLAKYTGWGTALGRRAGENEGQADRWKTRDERRRLKPPEESVPSEHPPRPHPGDERRELPPKGSRENTVSQPLDQPDDA